MSYGGWQEDENDALESKDIRAMRSILAEFNNRGLDISSGDFLELMNRAGVICHVEVRRSRAVFGDFARYFV